MKEPEIADRDVRAVFDNHPSDVRHALLKLRDVVFAAAATSQPRIDPLVETLKWGQISYLPGKPRVGITVRIDAAQSPDHVAAIYFHCQTRLLDTFRERYPDAFTYSGNRAIELAHDWEQHRPDLQHCVGLALTYHLWK